MYFGSSPLRKGKTYRAFPLTGICSTFLYRMRTPGAVGSIPIISKVLRVTKETIRTRFRKIT